MNKSLIDLHSKRRVVEQKELGEFKEWRAARERAGKKYTPHDQAEWDKAVSKDSDDDDEG